MRTGELYESFQRRIKYYIFHPPIKADEGAHKFITNNGELCSENII